MKKRVMNSIIKIKGSMESAIIRVQTGQFDLNKLPGDSHFISVMVVIIIVLVIAVMFREKMMSIFTEFFSKTTTQINNLFPA